MSLCLLLLLLPLLAILTWLEILESDVPRPTLALEPAERPDVVVVGISLISLFMHKVSPRSVIQAAESPMVIHLRRRRNSIPKDERGNKQGKSLEERRAQRKFESKDSHFAFDGQRRALTTEKRAGNLHSTCKTGGGRDNTSR